MDFSFVNVDGNVRVPIIKTGGMYRIAYGYVEGSTSIFAPHSLKIDNGAMYFGNFSSPLSVHFNGKTNAPTARSSNLVFFGGPSQGVVPYGNKVLQRKCWFGDSSSTDMNISDTTTSSTSGVYNYPCGIGVRFKDYVRFSQKGSSFIRLNLKEGITSHIGTIKYTDFPNGILFAHGLILGFPKSWRMKADVNKEIHYDGYGRLFPGLYMVNYGVIKYGDTGSFIVTCRKEDYLLQFSTHSGYIDSDDNYDYFVTLSRVFQSYSTLYNLFKDYQTDQTAGNVAMFDINDGYTGTIKVHDAFMSVEKVV